MLFILIQLILAYYLLYHYTCVLNRPRLCLHTLISILQIVLYVTKLYSSISVDDDPLPELYVYCFTIFLLDVVHAQVCPKYWRETVWCDLFRHRRLFNGLSRDDLIPSLELIGEEVIFCTNILVITVSVMLLWSCITIDDKLLLRWVTGLYFYLLYM